MLPEMPPFPSGLRNAGLYLHIPFCKNLCPYCPYHRVKYEEALFARFEEAVHREIEVYAPHLEGTEFVSLYIGGGTPTVDLDGFLRIVGHLRERFTPSGDICVELHPASMDDACLAALCNCGVTMVSIGVESTSDVLLKKIGRSHGGAEAVDAVKRAVEAGFEAINVDLMFALPGQTLEDWETDLRRLFAEGIDQLSTYPMFSFPYSELGKEKGIREVTRPGSRQIRALLAMTDRSAEENGFRRCAVWSWLKPRKKKFSSITRHHYVGFGPSAASMTGTHFYVNTFDIDAYAGSFPEKRPVAVSMKIDERLEMAYWLYWRLYELFAADGEFRTLFSEESDLRKVFGPLLFPVRLLGMMRREPRGYRVTRSGAYWIHRLQNEYSLSYINRLWGTCRKDAWPVEVKL
jgi:oxygen-independent coproporphyrinogen-3 oxidase